MKTVLFGLDGATFTVLDHLVGLGEMPNLKKVYDQGVRSNLLSTPLPITPQAWTSMSTGRSMGHHGLNDFVRIELSENQAYVKFNTSRDNHCETIWRYASRCGMSATVLNYFGTAPPEEINGHSIAGFIPARHLRRSSYPSDLIPRLKDLGTIDVKLLGLEIDMEKQALSDMPRESWIPWIEHHIAREGAWFGTMEHLWETEPSDLTVIVFDGVDKVQHLAYEYLDPSTMPAEPDAWQAEVIEKCRVYFRKIDEYLGRTMELVGDEGRIFIASDHGFTASTEIVYINKWLQDEGYLVWNEEQKLDDKDAIFVDHLKDHLNLINMKETTAFALTPSSNGIFIKVEPERYESFRDELVAKLKEIKGPDGGQVIADVKLREEWFPGPFMHHAPDLTLTLRDFGHISVLNAAEVVVPRKEPWGTHHPDGTLLGWGPGLRTGEMVDRVDMLDVAPLLAHSLGLEIPAEYEGTLPESYYEAAYLKSDPPVVSRTAALPVDEAVVSDEDEDEDNADLLERLKTLGYL